MRRLGGERRAHFVSALRARHRTVRGRPLRAVRAARPGGQRRAGRDLARGPGLADAYHRARGQAAGGLVVVLDQAEALLDRTEAEVTEAADLLFPDRRPAGLRVLVTLRADFMDAMLKHPRLGPALRVGKTLPLTPMSRAQLDEVIVKPLERIPAVAYDPGLDRRILDDARDEPGILPLLGFVLEQLWERRAAGRLRSASYEAMGGVSGALELHARTVWQECVDEQAEAEALRLLTGLVRVHPGSETPLRRRLTREEAGVTRWRLARSFAERRLLVLHGGEEEPETAELAHEALISAWPALRRQVKADGAFLAGRAELGHDHDRWERGSRSADLLPGGQQLAAIGRWLGDREQDLTEEERAFLALARQRQRAHRTRTRIAWTAAALVLALIAGLGTFLVYQSSVSEQREAEARSRSLASLSGELVKRDPGQAALAAVAAYDIAPTQEARTALMRRYDQFKDDEWVLTGAEGKIKALATSLDGAVTLVVTETGARRCSSAPAARCCASSSSPGSRPSPPWSAGTGGGSPTWRKGTADWSGTMSTPRRRTRSACWARRSRSHPAASRRPSSTHGPATGPAWPISPRRAAGRSRWPTTSGCGCGTWRHAGTGNCRWTGPPSRRCGSARMGTRSWASGAGRRSRSPRWWRSTSAPAGPGNWRTGPVRPEQPHSSACRATAGYWSSAAGVARRASPPTGPSG
ncbi:hypothetical protein ACFQ2B_38375 [Streptomyces stramineus]